MHNYYVVQSWMINDLKLKGLEKDLFAIIYGYSQDGESKFYGSLSYLSALTGYTKQSIIASLKKLIDKGLLSRQEFRINNITYYKYYTEIENFNGIKETLTPGKETLTPGKETLTPGKETLPNNIDNNKNNNKLLFKNNNLIKKQKPENLYDKCVNLINDFCTDKDYFNNDLSRLLIQYLNLRLEMKEKPIYTNQWKGLLNKLKQISKEHNQSYKDIINQSIEKGYASFYPVNQYNRKSSNIHWHDEYNEPEEQYEQQKEKF